jgi:8-oxo-dGTP pyrophosphatase MutT (NUDIX family)
LEKSAKINSAGQLATGRIRPIGELANEWPARRKIAASEAASTVARVKRNEIVCDRDGWETVSTVEHFSNAHLEVVTDSVRTPLHSKLRSWTIAHRKAAVVIAPVTRDRKIILIRQERIPIRAAIWEMPSGQIDQGGADREQILQVARRELREEAGYELAADGEMIALGYFFSSPGFTDEHCYFFLAQPVEPCADFVRDRTEAILECRPFAIEELRRMIAENEIRDANTLGICARLATRGLLSLNAR